MATVMKASEFVKKVKDIADNYKTLYVMGCFGAPLNDTNKVRYCDNHEYNRQLSRKAYIKAASADTFGFDCVCLIKGVLWGWCGDKRKTYGGAKYACNGVPDIGANAMIKKCSGVSKDFSKIEVGEALWCEGHIGVYIGDGLAVECTPKWKNCVQVTAVGNIGTKSGYNTRTWVKHGKLPYIDYTVKVPSKPKAETAKYYDKKLAGKYKIYACGGLHIRTGAGTDKTDLGVLKINTIVTNYGYYNNDVNKVSGKKTKWLCVTTSDGIVGYCSSRYLKKI